MAAPWFDSCISRKRRSNQVLYNYCYCPYPTARIKIFSVYGLFFFSLQNTNTPLWQSWRQRWLFVWNWNAETGVILPRHWFPRTLNARWLSFVLWPLAWFDFLFAFSFITWIKYIHTPTGRSHTTGASRSSCSQSFILGLQNVHNICGQVRNRLVLSPLHNIT